MMALSSGRAELAAVGIAASLYHVLNHAVFKGLLFLGAGGVVMATGTRHIEEMGGLARRMPWTALFFLVGSAAISGLPLLNGFVSEWLLFQAFLFGFQLSPEALVRFLFPVAGALLALTSALAAACFVKAFGVTFLALPRGEGSGEGPRVAVGDARRRRRSWPRCAWSSGLFPGFVLEGLRGVAGVAARGAAGAGDGARDVRDRAGPGALRPPRAAAGGGRGAPGCWALAGALSLFAGYRVRRAPTWGCGGELIGADGVHGDGVLEAADDDLQRDLPADARGAGGGGGVLPARGDLPGGDRADVRAVPLRAADAGRAQAWRSA